MIIGPSDTPYEGGFFPAKLEFPSDFPNSPPVMTFIGPIWHPNGLKKRFFLLFFHFRFLPHSILVCLFVVVL